ncbi:hypothetical protein ABT336_26475, partial [Micromonospora sp. NPDC000207]
MKGFWLHLRNSPIRWALPVLVLLDLAVIFLRTRHWMGVWPETGAAAEGPEEEGGHLGRSSGLWPDPHPVAGPEE